MHSDDTGDNIFKISDPETWWCRITHVSDGHKLMTIELNRLNELNQFNYNEKIHITFRKVMYFSGPMSWIGANFRLAQNDELVKFQAMTHEFNFSYEDHLLFICSMFSHPIQLLANAGGSTDINGNDLVMVPDPRFRRASPA
ncbi:MAG TPA: hypothetical protein VHL11_03175 [Phototrophicaceae bacterium]|jgi:hypothetical protein|nr:hypothetical protein [Phototrophicaceae bacterium]